MVHTAVAAAVVVLLAIALISAPRDTPPAIAEIAPHAVQQITQAPQQQVSSVGHGTGPGRGPLGTGGAGGKPTPQPTLPPKTGKTTTPRLRHCFDGRQIEDPQSPPCVPFYDGVNPGATSMGVTATTISVIAPNGFPAGLVNFFNNSFEFYGRHLVVTPFSPTSPPPPQSGCDPSIEQGDADTVASMHPFASLTSIGCTSDFYYTELARQHVISTTWSESHTTTRMNTYAPYLWQYPMAVDQEYATLGAWVCHRLAGRVARFAGSNGATSMSTWQRKFGVLEIPADASIKIDDSPLLAELKTCGVTADVYQGSAAYRASGDLGNYTAVLSTMKNNKDTSIICLCLWAGAGEFARDALEQTYTPEWLLGDYSIQVYNETLHGPESNWPSAELQHAFGISVHPRQTGVQDDFAVKALSAGTGADQSRTFATDTERYGLWGQYRDMLLLASGIQAAGPNLTPQTFQEGLQRLLFPNPITTIHAGFVGFDNGTHAMTDDATEWWWNNSAATPFPDEPSGSICYVDHGIRRTADTFPRGDAAFFTPTCDSGGNPGDP